MTITSYPLVDEFPPCMCEPDLPIIGLEDFYPSSSNQYEYRPSSLKEATESQIESVLAMIGVSKKVEQKGYTTLQLKERKALLNGLLGFTVNAFLYTENIVPFIATVGLVASLVIGVGGYVYYRSFYDLEDFRQREGIVKEIHTWDFKKLNSNFKCKDIIQYDLLGVMLNTFAEKEKARVYANISNLYEDKDLLDKKLNQILDTIVKAYRTGLDRLRKRYPKEYFYVSHNGFISKHERRDPEYYKIENFWNSWKNRQMAYIKKTYDHARDCLNDVYLNYLKDVVLIK